MTWINETDHAPCKGDFVLDKYAELSKGPTMLDATLCLTNRDAMTDTLEMFEDKSAIAVFGFRDQLLAQTMVDVPSEPLFFAAAPLQQALGSFCPFRLQLFPESRMPMT